MKKLSMFVACLSGLLLFALATPSFAKDADGKEKTITGMGKCAKCALHETDKCQNAIETENAKGKKVVYYLADNQVSKDFHDNLCKKSEKITATGTVKKVDGKMELTATKIEEAK